MKRKFKKKRYLLLILTLILLFSILIFFFFFSFKEVDFENPEFNQSLKPYFQNKTPYQIFSHFDQIFLNFPEIIKLEIYAHPFQRKLKIKVVASQPVAEICDLKNCFYLDNYARIISLPSSPELKLIKIISFLPIEKDSLLNPKIKNFLALIFEYANWKPLILKQIKIYANFDAGVIDEKDRQFLFDLNRDLEEQIKKLHLFLIKEYPGSRIDLRIPQKIYFR